MSDDDLERRLRRTYRAVAAATTIDEGDTHRRAGRPVTSSEQPVSVRMVRILAVAAGLVALVAGLVVLGTRSGERPADQPSAERRHVLPAAVPRLMRVGDSRTVADRPLPLMRLETHADGDVLTYAWDRGGVVIETRPGLQPRNDGVEVIVRDDFVGNANEAPNGAELTWADDHVVVTISTFGEQAADVDELVRIADSLVFVDDEVWERAIAFTGFSRTEVLADLGGGWVLDGSLQSDEGIGVRRGGYGFTGSIGSGDGCFAYVTAEQRDKWFVVASGRFAGRQPTLPDGSVIEPLRLLPGTNLSVGDFSFPAGDGASPDVSCEGLE